MGKNKGGIVAIFLLIVLVSFVFVLGYKAGKHKVAAIGIEVNLLNKNPDLFVTLEKETDFSPFWKVWSILNNKFVGTGTTTDQKKVWGAIQGLTESLGDPYTVFMPPEESEQFTSEISGSFEGIGAELGIKADYLTVIAPLKGTPAERAGIKSGDKIVEIDGKSAEKLKVEEAVKLIRGKKGTAVKLTIVRDGVKAPIEISVVRDTIKIPTVETDFKKATSTTAITRNSRMSFEETLKREGIYTIRLFNFYADSSNQFRNALRGFTESGAHKLILDLRGNPGGYLEAAVEIAGWFLPPGAVVVREDFGGKQPEQVYRSKGPNPFGNNLKMVILVDKGSASASEILAGALRENGRAILVGEKTFGKGTVQELVPVTENTSLKVTIAKWLTPNGKSISDGGLTPDVEVKITEDDVKNKKDQAMNKAIELIKLMP